jgi:hypothetical protein
MSSDTLMNTACNPTPFLPGSGLETTLSHHHNGVMTYSHYVNGSIFSVPKFEVVAKNNSGFSMGHTAKASDHLVETVYGLVKFFLGASGTNQGAIDNRIEQAMDLVKSHLMNAVRSEVEELKEKVIKLEETISQQSLELTKQHTDFNREVGKLQAENEFLRTHVGPEVITQLSNLQTVNQQQNQVQQNIQDSQSIQVSTTKQAAPSTQPQQTHQ